MQLDQSVQILILAAVTFVTLQALKRFLPGICGKHAIAINLAMTAAGVVLAAHPHSWADAITLVLTGSGVAAGIHGTVRSFRAGEGCDTPSPLAVPVWLVAILCGTLTLSGCAHRVATAKNATAPALPTGAVDATDAASNRALQTAHAFANRITVDVSDGKLQLSAGQRTAMGKLDSALNIADTYEIEYHTCGVAHAANTTLPGGCDSAKLTAEVALIQELFADAELALTPTTK